MSIDALSRLSFGVAISLHYLFPMLTIGGFFWMFIQSWSKKSWEKIGRNTGPLALFVLLGISTGYVLKWHFEKIWTPYYQMITDIFNPVLGLEAPASLLGFVLSFSLLYLAFRTKKLWLLRTSTALLFVTTLISATAIVSVNSWMQFPSGIRLINTPLASAVERTSLYEVIFSPTFWTRFTHTIIGALTLGIAWFISRFRRIPVRALFTLLFLWVAQFYVGHRQAKESYAYQPEKFAAFEGHQSVYGPADLWLLPTNDSTYNVKIEGLASKMLNNGVEGSIYGLHAWGEGFLTDLLDAVFASYHTMVIAHFTMLMLLIYAWYQRLDRPKRAVQAMKFFVFVSFVANYAGWYTAEMGRQPWIIRGVLYTRDASVPASAAVAYTGIVLIVVSLLIPLIIWRILNMSQRIRIFLEVPKD